MKRGIITILLSAVISGLTAFAVVKTVTPSNESTSTIVQADGSTYRTVNLSQDNYPDFTYAAESAVDAVVYVKVTSVTSSARQTPNSILEFFFGYPGEGQQRERVGSGSGVIIREDGYIVTNNHVIDGADKIEVTLTNNQTYPAVLVGTDPATDVALLKIDASGLPVIPFGDSSKLRLGEWVIAIGSPYDLRSTITAGIVSAKGRSMPNYTGEFKIESFIQTDAAVNPGNSGGALVDKAGNLVGINTAIISQTGSYAGYSFAVPSNIVKKIVYDLIDFGSVKRALLGITMQPVDEKIAKEMKLSSLNGVYIYEVSKNGAADKAGIKAGDVLVAIDSVKVTDGASVQEAVSRFSPGEKAMVTVIRDGKEKQFEVTFQGTASENGTVSEDGSVAFYGSSIRKAPEDVLRKFGLKEGVEIVDLGPGKMKDAGASQGFIILYVNNKAVKTPEDVIEIVKKSDRAVFIEGVTASGRSGYFGFGK
ncbi:MAG: Do family serine endopeptidase [Bacteroidales bacterium]|nr:Do family serine endopeptidase [Bacteroidales bacterium]MDD5890979.1 Do family serine endopeptidase [Bacteroidales bacterium]MDY5357387.1 Do family serine endopeptidase [Candidatus Cryptobacteroides sp.]